MKRILIITILLLSASTALAYEQTDFACLNNCTATGAQYQFCMSRCTVDNSSTASQEYQQPKRVDFACVRSCTASGSMYSFCIKKCEY